VGENSQGCGHAPRKLRAPGSPCIDENHGLPYPHPIVQDDKTRIGPQPGKFKYSAALGKRALLIILSRADFGATFIIDQPALVLGRQKDSDCAINDTLLSRHHCRVTADETGDYWLEDLGSTNGTYLNSRKVQEKMRLSYGDRIMIGNTILRFYLEEEKEAK
jgi:hypothetical protein